MSQNIHRLNHQLGKRRRLQNQPLGKRQSQKKHEKPTKAEKTPKPTWKKTRKPTKEEKTPKPTVWKAEKTPKPTWHKMEKTPKPTVWKSSDHDKAPKHYSMNEEEEESDDEATGYLDSVMNF